MFAGRVFIVFFSSLENIGGYIFIYMNYVNIYVYIYIYMCVCVCVCVYLLYQKEIINAKIFGVFHNFSMLSSDFLLLYLFVLYSEFIYLFACFFVFIYCGRVLCRPGCTPTCYVANDCFELLILVSSSLAGFTCVLYHTQFYMVKRIEVYQLI